MFVIKSGKNGNTADVNDLGELLTLAVTQSLAIRKGLASETFLITTPIINLTSDALSYILWIRNADQVPWIVVDSFFRFGTSVNGSGDFYRTGALNPTGGTLLTAGTAFQASNLDLSNQIPLNGSFVYGAEGSTISGQLGEGQVLLPETPIREDSTPIIFRPGTSFAFGVKPPSGNTSMNVQFALEIVRGD